MEIAVIGAGIAGEVAATTLISAGHRVSIYDPGGGASASQNSTGVVGSFGATPGHSLLGDLLAQALPLARDFYRRLEHPSALEAPLDYIYCEGSGERESFTRRFGHLEEAGKDVRRESGILLDTPALLAELRRRNDHSPLCSRHRRYITSWNQVAHHRAVLYAPGATRRLFGLDGQASKPRPGAFLQWRDFGPPAPRESFHYDFYRQGILSYRRPQGKLLLGTVNPLAGESKGPGKVSALAALYRQMQELLGRELELPPFARAAILSGVRELAPDRLPRLHSLGGRRYAVVGLHKNGLTLAPYFAQQLLGHLAGGIEESG